MEKRLARREKSRVLWIDGVRFLAFGVVFTRHYFESFFPENIPEVRGGISAFLWRGITGKAAVSMFCVLLGYFVAASVKKYAFSEYTIRRYLYFMTHLLVVNVIAVMCVILFTLWKPAVGSVFIWSTLDLKLLWQWFFSDSLFFSYYLVPTFWCVADFFLASILIFFVQKGYAGRKSSHAMGRGEYYRIAVLYIILAISLRGTWIANCLLGALLWIINDLRPPVLEKRVTLVILTVAMIVLYRMPNYTVENYSDYLAWGMSSFLCLLVCFRVKVLKRILGFPLFSVLGKYAFELYLSHVIVMNACMGFLYAAWETYLSRPLLIWVGYGSCFVLSLLLAFGIKKCAQILQQKFLGLYMER